MSCYETNDEDELSEQSNAYDEMTMENDELQCESNDSQEWTDDCEYTEEGTNDDASNSYDCQSEKRKTAETNEALLQKENCELNYVNDCKTERLRMLNENIQKLLEELKELKMCKKRTQCNLCSANVKANEKCCLVKKTMNTIECIENEYRNMQRQLEEYLAACNRLNDSCRCLEEELQCRKTRLADAKCYTETTDKNIKQETETLTNKLKIKCQKLRDMEVKYNKYLRTIDEEKSKKCELETSVMVLREAINRDRCRTNAQIQQIKKENCAKDGDLCLMKSKIEELTRKVVCVSSEIGSLKTQGSAIKCLLDKIKHSTELMTSIKTNNLDVLESEKSALVAEIREKKTKIVNLQQKDRHLRETIKKHILNERLETNECELNLARKFDKFSL